MATTIHISASSFGRFRTATREQRVHGILWRVHALLVQSPIPNRGFGKHNRSQHLPWHNEKATELRKNLHAYRDFSNAGISCLLPIQLC